MTPILQMIYKCIICTSSILKVVDQKIFYVLTKEKTFNLKNRLIKLKKEVVCRHMIDRR